MKLALRYIRTHKSLFCILSLNIILGLVGFSSLDIFKHSLEQQLSSRSKRLLTADFAISTRRAFSHKEKGDFKNFLEDDFSHHHEVYEVYSMLKDLKSKKSRLTFLVGIEKEYPFFGNIEVDGRFSKAKELLTNGIWLSEDLKTQLRLVSGDKVKLGSQELTVMGTISNDSSVAWKGFNLAPYAYVHKDVLLQTNLLQKGSTFFHTLFYKSDLPKKELTLLKESFDDTFSDTSVKFHLPADRANQIGRVFGLLSDYLGLVAIMALLLSIIGSVYLYQTYFLSKISDVAILRSIGHSKKMISSIFIIQMILISVFASSCALALSSIALPKLLSLFEFSFGDDFLKISYLNLLFKLLSISFLSNLFILIPFLKKIFENKVNTLFDRSIHLNWKLGDLVLFIPLLALFYILCLVQSNSIIVGSLFFFALLVVFILILTLCPFVFHGRILKLITSRTSSSTLKIALRYLFRNKMSTVFTCLCISMGGTLISIIIQLEAGIEQELVYEDSVKPSLFMFDIQEEQVKPLQNFAHKNNFHLDSVSPMIRARIRSINGENFSKMKNIEGMKTREKEREKRFRNRGVNLSYGKGLNESETLVEGVNLNYHYDKSKQDMAHVSIEKRYARRLGIKLGDTIIFDIMDIDLKAKVVSLRSVKWASFKPNFFIVLQPGVLEDAPKTYLANIGNLKSQEISLLQGSITDQFPNISMVNVSILLKKMADAFSQMGIALKIVAMLSLIIGIFIVISIATSQFEYRKKDIAILKSLGFKHSHLKLLLPIEFFVIILFSLFMSFVFSFIVSRFVSGQFFETVWDYNFASVALLFGLIISFSSLLLYFGTSRLIGKKVKGILSY